MRGNAESFKWARQPSYAGAGWIPSWWWARSSLGAVGCGLWADCYHQSLFEAQPCVTALAVVIQRPDLCDDFRGVGECFPSEAADPPSLSLE